MKDYPIPTSMCLACGYAFDRASNLQGKGAPDPGDITLCMRCGHMLRFTDKLTVVLVNEEEAMAELTPQQRRQVHLAKVAISLIPPSPETKH